MSKENCEGLAFVCVDDYQPVGTIAKSMVNERPLSHSLRNSTECSKCNGNYSNYFQFRRVSTYDCCSWLWQFLQSRWLQSRYIPGRWIERGWVNANKWSGTIDTAKFAELNARAVARRYSTILQRNILCRYGQSSQLLSQIACNCGTGSRDNCFAATQKQVTSVVYFCSSISSVETISSVTLRASDLMFDSVDCDSLTVFQVWISIALCRSNVFRFHWSNSLASKRSI